MEVQQTCKKLANIASKNQWLAAWKSKTYAEAAAAFTAAQSELEELLRCGEEEEETKETEA
jgi:hypothetical protein